MRGVMFLGLVLQVACAGVGVAPVERGPRRATRAAENVELSVSQRERATLRQLRGHLARMDSCMAQLRRRDRAASGLVDVSFTIGTDGRVGSIETERNTSGSAFLSRCLEQKLGSLYFDPAPPAAMTRTHRFLHCERGTDFACRLGPVRDTDDTPARGLVAEPLLALQADIVRCAANTGAEPAVLDVEVTVDDSGVVHSGRVRHAAPTETPLRRCAIAPLLNQRVLEEAESHEAQTLRFTLGVAPARATRLASTR